jgi:hypothetical protein
MQFIRVSKYDLCFLLNVWEFELEYIRSMFHRSVYCFKDPGLCSSKKGRFTVLHVYSQTIYCALYLKTKMFTSKTSLTWMALSPTDGNSFLTNSVLVT